MNKNCLLHTEGNKVLNAKNEAVMLYGTNCAGLEWDAQGEKVTERVPLAFDSWHANVIRLPLSQDRWFGYGEDQNGVEDGAEQYRKIVDRVVSIAAEREKYIILDLHWSNCGIWGNKIGQHRMADALSVNFWHDISKKFKNHPNVLFSLYNEPYQVEWEVWQSGGFVKKENFAASGMQTLINTVRANGAANIVVIGGLDWGFDLSRAEEFPLNDRGGCGIVYDSHIYPWKPAEYDKFVPPSLAEKFPILIGECGHYGDDRKPREGPQRLPHAEWCPELIGYIEKNGFHVTGWDFHPGNGPKLISDSKGTPTPYWGRYLKEFLLKHRTD